MWRSRGFLAFFVVLMLLTLLTAACGSDAIALHDVPTSTPTKESADIPDEGEIDNGFLSDDPRVESESFLPPSDPLTTSPSSPGTSSSSGGGPSAPEETPSFPEEHEIVQVEGRTLYALSRRGGFVVADATNPDQLNVVARNSLQGAVPVALYVRKNLHAIVVLNDVERWMPDPNHPLGGEIAKGSAIVTFDVSTPAKTREIGRYPVEGMITASKLAGSMEDVLFVVSYQWPGCWQCTGKATVVTSLSIPSSTPNVIVPIQTERFSSPSQYYWAQRTARFSERFLYLAGAPRDWGGPFPNWPSTEIETIELQADGRFVKHADLIFASGQVRHDWQIDETDGVLRILTESVNAGGVPNAYPTLQTYSADPTYHELLGFRVVSLPNVVQPIKVARFTRSRVFVLGRDVSSHVAIADVSQARTLTSTLYPTMLQRTLDIQTPDGLEQLTLLGFDGSNHLTAALIDTAGNITAPKRLSTVSLTGPGDMGTLRPELSSLQMIRAGSVLAFAIPFGHRSYWRSGKCETISPSAGVQLVELVHPPPPMVGPPSLVARGLVPLTGVEPPTRVMTNLSSTGELTHVYFSSPRSFASVDVTDRSAPILRTRRLQSNPAHRMVETPNHIATITSDPFTGEPALALAPKNEPPANRNETKGDANFVGQVPLGSLDTDLIPAKCDNPKRWLLGWDNAHVFAKKGGVGGDVVYVVVPSFLYEKIDPKNPDSDPIQHGKVVAAAIDITDPSSPKIVGRAEVPLPDQTSWYGLASSLDRDAHQNFWPLVVSGEGVVQVGPLGDRLAFLSVENVPTREIDDPQVNKVNRRLHVIDFADKAHPIVHPPIPLRESLGTTPLVVDAADGSTVMTTRWVRTGMATGLSQQVKFFVDRINAGGARGPIELASINVPGSLITRVGDRFVTAGYRIVRANGSQSSGGCLAVLGERARFDGPTNCYRVDRQIETTKVFRPRLRVIRETSVPLPSQHFDSVLIEGDRIYVPHTTRYDIARSRIIEIGGFWVVGGLAEGKPSIVSELAVGDEVALAVRGMKLATYNPTSGNTLRVYDTSTAKPSVVTERVMLRGAGDDDAASASSSSIVARVLLTKGATYCSLADAGLEMIP